MSRTIIKDNKEVNDKLSKLFATFGKNIKKVEEQWSTISIYDTRTRLYNLTMQMDNIIDIENKDIVEKYCRFNNCDHDFKEGEDSLSCDKCNLTILGIHK